VRPALIRAARYRPLACPVRIGRSDDREEAARAAAADREAERVAAAHARGVEEGREAALAAARDEVEAAVRIIEAAARGLAAERERLAEKAEIAVRELAVAIAAHVMRCEVEHGRPVAAALAAEAVERLAGPGPLTVRVHPDDAPSLQGRTASLVERAGGVALEVVGSGAIARGDCVVEGGGMRADARLLDGLALVAEELGATVDDGPETGGPASRDVEAGVVADGVAAGRSVAWASG
jgi:flagellar assembly protein FliH